MNKLRAADALRKSAYKKQDVPAEKTLFNKTQKNAANSIQFGLEMASEGYNVFALGEPGLGKHEAIMELAKAKAQSENVPDDYVYVYNFKDPDTPLYLKMPPGKGGSLATDMDELVENLRKEIPKIFDSKEFENEKTQILEKFHEFDRQIFDSLTEEARGRGFSLEKGTEGFMFLPMKDGEIMSEDKFSKLSEAERKSIQEKIKILQDRLKEAIKMVKEAEKETKRRLTDLEKKIVWSAISYHVEELREKYNFNEKILDYLRDVESDVLNNLEDFKQVDLPVPANMALRLFRPEPSFLRYKVNVFIDRSRENGAPIIHETNPNSFNLIGKVENRFQMGMAVTDFTLIKPGALHKANGGYLILDALDVFRNPFSYDILKRALKNKVIRIEDPLESYRMASGTLKPEPIPLNVKLIIIGNPYIYYILHNYDEDFGKIFKVKADFERDMIWDIEGEASYAFFIEQLVEKEGLLSYDDSGVQRVIECGGRLVEDQKKLSIKVEEIATIVREAAFLAKKAGKAKVYREDVYYALKAQKERHNKIEKRIQDLIIRDVFLITTDGTAIGTINALSVYDMGDYKFGRPSRITAKVSAGKDGITHLDREAKLSGKIHDKGSMVISAFLNSKFGQDGPLGLNATLCFEQLYEMVEGDSASLAEALALHSAMGNVPVGQGIAVTGSMNQHGYVQPIGGVNEKIEGFFEVCRERGLNGLQGVVIPKSNIQHLMLSEDVVEALEKGTFHVYAVEYFDDALEIFTGMKAGKRPEPGQPYPEDTVNFLVEKRVKELREKQKAAESKKKGKGKNDD